MTVRPDRNLLTTVLLVAFFALLVAKAVEAQSLEQSSGRPLGGTFIQLLDVHGTWETEKWRQVFDTLRQLGLSEAVVQWTLYDDTAFFPGSRHKTVPEPPLATIVELADKAGMKIVVGLAHDPEYWQKIRREPALVEVYLQRLRLRSEALATHLAPLLANHPAFQGWYIPQEIDDVSWRDLEARRILFQYLQDLSTHLRRITPKAKIAVSGFSNGSLDPRAFREFWMALLEKTSVETVYFQDGIGAGKLTMDELPLYLAALQKGVQARGRDLQVVIEIFRQVGGPPFDDGSFRAVPAPLERIRLQIELATRYSSSPPIAFSVVEYMTPLGGAEAERLFQGYIGTYVQPLGR